MYSETIGSELTQSCAPGFDERLILLMNEAGIHRRGFISFLADSTGLSQSGARRILDDKRPPKRLIIFLKLVDTLASELSRSKDEKIQSDQIKKFLIEGAPIGRITTKDDLDISPFLNLDPLRTSQIIIRIEEVARSIMYSKSNRLNSRDMRLIHFRIISYCFKNDADFKDQKITNMIESLVELANQNLL